MLIFSISCLIALVADVGVSVWVVRKVLKRLGHAVHDLQTTARDEVGKAAETVQPVIANELAKTVTLLLPLISAKVKELVEPEEKPPGKIRAIN